MATISLRIDKGLDNIHDPIALGRITDWRDKSVKVLTQAENVDIDDAGLARRRAGRTLVRAASAPHSFWSHPHNDTIAYFVAGGTLYRFNADFTVTSVAALGSDGAMFFLSVTSEIVVSNGKVIGWLYGTAFDVFAPDLEEFEAVLPAGQYLAFLNGVLVVAAGDTLFPSKPYNVERMDARFSGFPLDGYIRMLGAVEDGFWVGTDKSVGFIRGASPEEWTYTVVTDAVPIDGCFYVGFEGTENTATPVVYWASEDGFCVGRGGGRYTNVSEGQVRLPTGRRGFCVRKDTNGFEQYIAGIRNPSDSNIYSPDPLVINTHTI